MRRTSPSRSPNVCPAMRPGRDPGGDSLGDDGELEVRERLVEGQVGQVRPGPAGVALGEVGRPGNPASRVIAGVSSGSGSPGSRQ